MERDYIMTLLELNETIVSQDLDALWKTESKIHSIVTASREKNEFDSYRYDEYFHRIANCSGFYRWCTINLDNNVMLYSGSSEGVTMSIATRQGSHRRAFEKPDTPKCDSSGPNLHKWMEKHDLQSVQFIVEYIDTTGMQPGLALMLEKRTTAEFKTILNYENRGANNA